MEAQKWRGKIMSLLNIKEILNAERIYSRRNEVYGWEVRLNSGETVKLVVKILSDPNKSQEEANLLQYFLRQGINVPQVVWHAPGIIVLEFIPGVLLADLLAEQQANSRSWIQSLALWVAQYHRLTLSETGEVLLMQDANLRNFIYCQGKFYGIDFESSEWGSPAQDLGELCSFILNNDPAFTKWKFTIVDDLIECYQKETGSNIEKKVWVCIVKALEETIKRRPQQEKILREGIAKIQKEKFSQF